MGFRKRKPLQGCIFAFGIILILCFAVARIGAGSNSAQFVSLPSPVSTNPGSQPRPDYAAIGTSALQTAGA